MHIFFLHFRKKALIIHKKCRFIAIAFSDCVRDRQVLWVKAKSIVFKENLYH